MLALAHVVNANMSFGTARHSASNFLPHEEIGVVPQFFRAFYRVVVGEREQSHSALTQKAVNPLRVGIAFTAKLANKGCGTRPGKARVDMEITLHNDKGRRDELLQDDTKANLKIIQLLN